MAQEQGRVSCCLNTSQSATRKRLSEATMPGPDAPVMVPSPPWWPLAPPGSWVWAHSFSSNCRACQAPPEPWSTVTALPSKDWGPCSGYWGSEQRDQAGAWRWHCPCS